MDIHQKLVLIALSCFLVTILMEYAYPEVWGKWFWHPITIKDKNGQPIFYVATPTIMGSLLLILALLVG